MSTVRSAQSFVTLTILFVPSHSVGVSLLKKTHEMAVKSIRHIKARNVIYEIVSIVVTIFIKKKKKNEVSVVSGGYL